MPDEKAVPPEGSSVEPKEEQKKQKKTDEETKDEQEDGKNYRLMDTLAFDTETLKKIIQQQKDEKKDK